MIGLACCFGFAHRAQTFYGACSLATRVACSDCKRPLKMPHSLGRVVRVPTAQRREQPPTSSQNRVASEIFSFRLDRQEGLQRFDFRRVGGNEKHARAISSATVSPCYLIRCLNMPTSNARPAAERMHINTPPATTIAQSARRARPGTRKFPLLHVQNDRRRKTGPRPASL